MATQFPRLEPIHRDFILRQRMFFTASAASTGRVNLSPKGLDALRVLGPNEVVYLDLTGSGNETAAHLRADGRLTLMFCAFEGPPMILRLYGRGQVLRRGSDGYTRLLASEFGGAEPLGAQET
ncbi:pyridoxamine 5'-phosphate oxidase family protein [Corallococcus macrosporus]|uniref:Pyridoxamine 5'-phosphate oxidase family protein n=1 Tax=Myxococcus fulvus (strain ATCC BAA-855 / HW-1) TaxID=483219 RepID=F8CGX5_MYXFH|nr:pyridoxamine 5'-phosphate oxidase family protein [Corallococcus macrosporus]AEI63684.1 pyridoxamine 5'-phosphate oxidase family protein [Corallococcus macrosporus]